MSTLPSRSTSPDEADDLLFREQCRRQMQRPLEARMKCRRLVTAARQLGFMIDDTVERDIIADKDFIQLTDGPFDLNIVFAPDGIENYTEAKRRAVTDGIFPVANIRDIIASKKAGNRMKDRMNLHLLDLFRIEYESRQ